MKNSTKIFSIVIPVYYNAANLHDTIPRLLSLRDHLPHYQLELVFVDDGSGDDSLKILLDFQKQYKDIIQVVKLTRNFGAVAAQQAGFLYAHGDCVGNLAADLQDPPELFLEMLKFWENGTKAIFAVRKDRKDSIFQKIPSKIYHYLLRKWAIPDYPEGGTDCLLMDRQIVDVLNSIQEKNSSLLPLVFWLGYKPAFVYYTRQIRKKGRSRWTMKKKTKLFIDSFVSFSYFPIRVFSAIGISISLLAVLYGLYELYAWCRFGVAVEGWLSIILILTITAGIQMSMLGILGEYLWRTLDETRKRPHFVVDKIFPNNQNQ